MESYRGSIVLSTQQLIIASKCPDLNWSV